MNKIRTISKPIIITSDSNISERVDIVLHINVFLPNENINSYLEMGVLLSRREYNNFKRNFKININFPFKITRSSFEDLSDKLNDSSYLNMIFNEETYYDLDKKEFRLKEYRLGNIKLCETKLSSNSSIVISVNEKQANSYFRFRIKNIGSNILEKVVTSNLTNPFMKTIKIMGLSINETRFASKDTLKISFKEVNSFIIMDSKAELIEKSKTIKSFRVLEDKLWKDYIGWENEEMMTVYQFKDKALNDIELIKSYKLFLKTLHHDGSVKLMFKFIAIVVLIAIISNGIYDLAIKPLFED